MIDFVTHTHASARVSDLFSLSLTQAFPLSFKALDRGAAMLKVDKVATGHNADDIAETVLLNILRGDIARYTSFIGYCSPSTSPILVVCMYDCFLFLAG